MRRAENLDEELQTDEIQSMPNDHFSKNRRPSPEHDAPITIEHVILAVDLDRRAALVTVKVGELRIRGVEVWRSRSGHLSVRFPAYRAGSNWEEAFELSDDRRTEMETEVLAAFRAAMKRERAEAKAREKARIGKEGGDPSD